MRTNVSVPTEGADFTVFDFETTGLSPYGRDRICEIGAIRVSAAGGVKKFHSMVDPGVFISRGAFMVNGITPSMLEGAPVIADVIPEFMEFISGSFLVAYNAGFDCAFLEAALGGDRSKLEGIKVVDALSLSRRLFNNCKGYSLARVASFLGVDSGGAHRAMADCEITLKVFKRQLEILREKGETSIDGFTWSGGGSVIEVVHEDDHKMRLLEEAINGAGQVEITYFSEWKNETSKRLISPRSLFGGYDSLYLSAYCHTKKGDRTFKVKCIREVKAAGRRPL